MPDQVSPETKTRVSSAKPYRKTNGSQENRQEKTPPLDPLEGAPQSRLPMQKELQKTEVSNRECDAQERRCGQQSCQAGHRPPKRSCTGMKQKLKPTKKHRRRRRERRRVARHNKKQTLPSKPIVYCHTAARALIDLLCPLTASMRNWPSNCWC